MINQSQQPDSNEIKWGGFLNEFLWTCAGVNKRVLRQCPTDYAKYAGIGGTILFTALMAMLSGGYAMMSVFDKPKIAIAFGIFWGLLIFNLDRFIVNTMYSDGKHTISRGELAGGLPRIIIAVFLGIVISTPLELRIFQSEIHVRVEKDKKVALEEYTQADKAAKTEKEQEQADLKSQPLIPIMDPKTGNEQIDKLIDAKNNKFGEYQNVQNQIKQCSNQMASLNKNIASLPDGPQKDKAVKTKNALEHKRGALRIESGKLNSDIRTLESQIAAMNGAVSESQKEAMIKREKEIAYLQTQIDALDNRIKNAEAEHKKELDDNYGGFQAKLRAFGELRDENTTTDIAAWAIMLLFVIIEIVPTIFKMMIEAGPYDDLLRSEMHRVKVLSNQRISDLNDEVNTAVTISTRKNQDRIAAEVMANEKLLENLATAQAEMLGVAIDKWREQEMQKIEENPSDYIQGRYQ